MQENGTGGAGEHIPRMHLLGMEYPSAHQMCRVQIQLLSVRPSHLRRFRAAETGQEYFYSSNDPLVSFPNDGRNLRPTNYYIISKYLALLLLEQRYEREELRK